MDDPSVGPKIPQALEKILQLKESRQEEMNSQQGECHHVPEGCKERTWSSSAGAESASLIPFLRRVLERNWFLVKNGYREQVTGQ